MSAQNNFWCSNIKFLRNRNGLNHEALAGLTGIPSALLRAYESGRLSLPTLNHLLDCSGFFGVGVDVLLKVNLAILPARAIAAFVSGEDVYLSGNKIRSITSGVYDRDERRPVLSVGHDGRLTRFRRAFRKGSYKAVLGKNSEQCTHNSPS